MNYDINDEYNKNIQFSINDKILIYLLIVNGLSISLSVFLTYIFSNSIISILCAILIGATIGVIINYFILTRFKLFKDINISLIQKNNEDELKEFQTIMK